LKLVDLATHRAGVPMNPPNLIPSLQGWASYGKEELLESLEMCQPGDRSTSGYSNYGYALLGTALATACDVTFEFAVKARVLSPCGMTATGFRYGDVDPDRLVIGHLREESLAPADFVAMNPAGGALSSAGDLVGFLSAHLRPQQCPIGEAIVTSRQLHHSPLLGQVGLGWHYNPGAFYKNGATGGFGSMVVLRPDDMTAVVVLTNSLYSGAVERAAWTL
jgi:serine-type D-Ala-D-Ala carboxypeptidase/endopeptidase